MKKHAATSPKPIKSKAKTKKSVKQLRKIQIKQANTS